jgi:DNA-binding transcriptional regulator YhcF (GntR family)
VQIDYDSGEPVYLQIARLLRDQIIQGELQVGAQLPSGNEMQASRGVTRVTYQHAVDQLREAGLVVTRMGKGTFVVAVPMLQVIGLSAGDQVTARMPTEAEREQLDTGLTPVLVVTRADGAEEVFPAAVTVCQAQPDQPKNQLSRTDPAPASSVPLLPAPKPPLSRPPHPARPRAAQPSRRPPPAAVAYATYPARACRRRAVPRCAQPPLALCPPALNLLVLGATAPRASWRWGPQHQCHLGITARSSASPGVLPPDGWRWRRPARGRGPVRPGCGRAGRPGRGRFPRG